MKALDDAGRVPRAPFVPPELTVRPFTIEEARQFGVDRWHLEGSMWKRLAPGVYAWTGLEESPGVMVAAAALRLPADAVFSGETAAWLHGLETNPCDPIEVTVPPGAGLSMRTGLCIRRSSLAKDEIAVVNRMRVTAVERTLLDVSEPRSLTEAVVLADKATHMRLTDVGKLEEMAARSSGRPGVATFRRAIAYIEPATESQMESRFRMLIVLSGLPRPVAQHSVYDDAGVFLGRVDFFYPDAGLGLEYDGELHGGRLPDDNRRQNLLLGAGIRLLRFTAGDIYNRPQSVIEQIRGALRSAKPRRPG